MTVTEYPWLEPLQAACALEDEPHLTLLYSGLSEHHTGRYSLLGWGMAEQCTASHWHEIAARLSRDKPWHENAWFGWLGYGMRLDHERLTRGNPPPLSLPDTRLTRYRHLLRFDHLARRIVYITAESPDLRWQAPTKTRSDCHITRLSSPMNKKHYLACVKATRERIEAGDFYQANITRKFNGHITNKGNYISTFSKLCSISPAPYSAYIRDNDTHILSSSPECFLTIDTQGRMVTRPIKGSAPRGTTPGEDEAIRHSLLTSTKDHAENRMIVDLMRNDLSRSAAPGTVRGSEAELASYATVHHLVATVEAKKRDEISTLDAVKSCFPPGSMTGAPKIAAMEWCREQEQLERGVYSGAIGWFGGDGSCDLSVVIRTLIVEGDRFEFQVGGGIVADSDPEKEWQETLIKARGIAALLGIKEEELAAL